MSQCVEEFLCECKTLISARKFDLFLNDHDNRNTMNLLLYTPSNILQELIELEITDLYKGPEPDNNSKYPGEVFIFKKSIQSYLIYIKIKIRDVKGRREVFLMSFHPDRP